MQQRCAWAQHSELEIDYHDREWGVPVHDERKLFEMLILEGAQAGLSWSLILKRRTAYRQAFDNFEAAKVARYDANKIQQLLGNAEIIRNKLKINAACINAKAFLKVQHEFGRFDTYLWRFVDGAPIQNAWASIADVPAHSTTSEALSKDLKKRGFKFVGTTICYAFMQAIGMVNDHTVDCFRHGELKAQAAVSK